MLAALLRPAERVVHDPLHTERSVDADLGGDLIRCADPDCSTCSGVRALGSLADHDEVDVGVARQRPGHTGIQPRRSQVDVMVEHEPDAKQQAALQHTAGHRRVTDRAEQDRIVGL